MEIRHAPTEPVHDRLANLFRCVRDDPRRLRLINPFQDDIDRLEGDEIREERVHRPVPAEDEAGCSEDEDVEEHDDLSDRERQPVREGDGENLRPVERPTGADDETDAGTEQEAPEDGRQQQIVRERFDIMQDDRERGHEQDCRQRDDGERLPDLPIPEIDERQVEEDEPDGEFRLRQIRDDDRDPDDPTVDDLVRNKERFQTDREDEGTEQQEDDFRKQFGRLDRIMFAP